MLLIKKIGWNCINLFCQQTWIFLGLNPGIWKPTGSWLIQSSRVGQIKDKVLLAIMCSVHT